MSGSNSIMSEGEAKEQDLMSLREMIGRSLDDGDIGPDEAQIIKKQMESMKNGSFDRA